jgi:hypothetical protein
MHSSFWFPIVDFEIFNRDQKSALSLSEFIYFISKSNDDKT